MFSKKPHGDVKKSSLKVLDPKKDPLTRLKHLRIVLDNVDVSEAKTFFESYFSHIYHIFYDVFITVEGSLKQRAHKTHKEELDGLLYIFEKILLLLPELIHRRWQCHSIGRILKKLLHTGNTIKLRREAIRMFLIWYQILQDNAPEELHLIFASLIPGLPNPTNREGPHSLDSLIAGSSSGSVFHDSPVSCVEISPVLPPQAGEKQPDDLSKFLMECLMENMVSQVTKIEWKEKDMHQKCFHFLFESFKEFYLIHIFPNFCKDTCIYKPYLDVPKVRSLNEVNCRASNDPILTCSVVVVRWLANFTHCNRKPEPLPAAGATTSTEENKESTEPKVQPSDQEICHSNTSTLSDSSFTGKESSIISEKHSYHEYTIVRETLYSCRENVNILHEIFRQAFLLPFSQASSIRRVIAVYRDWIQLPEKPIFMHEPLEPPPLHQGAAIPYADDSDSSKSKSEAESPEYAFTRFSRLRNDSYLGAIHRDLLQGQIRAGIQNTLQIFITNAANAFLLELGSDDAALLIEQVDLCKRILNIYRYMVMNTILEQKTWEQLLIILLKITSSVLKEKPPVKKQSSLGGRLAAALFQTLIVTWIKSSLNVMISTDLWDQLLQVLSALTQWEELISEWAKTMETLTRVLARQVYNLDLNDLPLDRLSEQKQKKLRGSIIPPQPNNQSFSRGWSRYEGRRPTSSDPSKLVTIPSQRNLSEANSIPENQTGNSPTETSTFYTTRVRSFSGTVPADAHPHHPRSESSDRGFTRSNSDSNIYSNIGDPVKHPDSKQCFKDGSYTQESFPPIVIEESSENWVDANSLTPQVSPKLKHGMSDNSSENESQNTVSPQLKAGDDPELLGLDDSSDSIPAIDSSTEKDPDFLARDSANSSPISDTLERGSRTPSPSSCVESNSIKDSPMQIDVVVSGDDHVGDRVCRLSEDCSVMAGGTVQGWLPEIAVVLWRRMLGILGDLNEIKDPDIHAQVYKHLIDLFDTLVKIRENLGVTLDNQSSPPPPELIPPLFIFSPWLLKATSLPDKFLQGKLHALRLLCTMIVRRNDVHLPFDQMIEFYKILHRGLVGTNQAIASTIVKYCGPTFFALSFPGSTMLILDFIHAANTIVSANELKEFPRTEAVSLLGSLLCFPNLLTELLVLQPSPNELATLPSRDIKDHIVNVILKSGKKEPAGLARCISLSCLGIYLYEELVHLTMHSKIKEAINVLLATLRFNNKAVAQIASDILMLLCDHIQQLLLHFPDVPEKVIEAIANTLLGLLPEPEYSVDEESKKLIITLLFALCEWCMRVPLTLLSAPSQENKSLLTLVFKVLNAAITGKGDSSKNISSHLADVIDYDPNIQLDNLKEICTSPPGSPKSPNNSPNKDNSSVEGVKTSSPVFEFHPENDIIRLTARTIMCHLINHLNHFPMNMGASRLTSLVNEFDDIPGLTIDELSSEIFHVPNVQFFVLNKKTLISFVEIPALNVPGGGVTAGLKTAKSQVRLIIRDIGGKFTWDSSILYGPPHCKQNYMPSDPLLEAVKEFAIRLEIPETKSAQTTLSIPRPYLKKREPHEFPIYEINSDEYDNLNDLLQYIGYTSPECLHRLGQAINIPSPSPSGISEETESSTVDTILNQRDYEMYFFNKHKSDSCAVAKPLIQTSSNPPTSAFQHCRLLLNQLGLLSWENRPHFDLLKKNEKLLRELKNLDNQNCRETHKIAVIYVAEGQEDKNSVLLNAGGSKAYEEFLAGLAWEVDLQNHTGFIGGLARNKSTGETAPYYATSCYEVVFHVSTRMPTFNDDSMTKKLRHLGNDEIHIVWSEHTRDYRRGIIATEFGDVLIVIYPIPNRLYRIQIVRKPEVPYFGPLFNGAIVDHKVLPGLVRATAINASRAKRSLITLYQSFYEERTKCVETVIQNHIDRTCYEDFAAQVFSPGQTTSGFQFTQGGSLHCESSSHVVSGSNLAAALIDSHASTSPSHTRHASLENKSPIPYHQFKGSNFSSGEDLLAAPVDDTHFPSPKLTKRLSLKSARKSSGSKTSSTPPESPVMKPKK